MLDVPALAALAARLLAGRPHARGELRAKLLRVATRAAARAPPAPPDADAAPPARGAAAAVDATLGELASRGLLDDAQYALWHAAQRAPGGARPRSRAQLAGELAAKRVASADAAAPLLAHSDAAAAAAVAARKPRMTDAELRRHLAWKGFNFQTIARVVEQRRESRDAGSSSESPPPPLA
jgi:SOS response regulatory protein OraA/RecX